MIYPTNTHIINIGDNIMWVEGGDFNREWDWVSALEELLKTLIAILNII